MLEQRVRYLTSGELLEDLTAALADQTIHDRVRFYAKFSLLIVDAFGFDRSGQRGTGAEFRPVQLIDASQRGVRAAVGVGWRLVVVPA